MDDCISQLLTSKLIKKTMFNKQYNKIWTPQQILSYPCQKQKTKKWYHSNKIYYIYQFNNIKNNIQNLKIKLI
jgi:hypothetical protein